MGLVVATLGASATAQAEHQAFNVDTTLDLVDMNIGDGVCAADPGGEEDPVCTLRAAIQEANAHAGADTIVLSAETYNLTLTASDGTIDSGAEAGDLDIHDHLTITGVLDQTIIDGQAQSIEVAANRERVIDIQNGDVTITGVNVRNGEWRNNGGGIRVDDSGTLTMSDGWVSNNVAGEDGGGFYVHSEAAVTLRRVTLSHNDALWGGGVYNNSDGVEPANPGEPDPPGLLIEDSTLRGNDANVSEGGGYGGGIYNDDEALIVRTHVGISDDGNTADRFGGGIYNDIDTSNGNVPAELTMVDSFVTNNQALNGGGLYNDAIAVLTNTDFDENFVFNGAGGAIYNGGRAETVAELTVASSDITGNVVEANVESQNRTSLGGGIHNEVGEVATVLDSTIAGNVAEEGAGIFNEGWFLVERSLVSDNGNTTNEFLPSTFGGGGIFNDADEPFVSPEDNEVVVRATIDVLNSTVSGNRAMFRGGGVYNEAVEVVQTESLLQLEPVPTVKLNHVTLTGNHVSDAASSDAGGGIYNEQILLNQIVDDGRVDAANTIIAGNTADVVELTLLEVGPSNCGGVAPVSGGYNLENADTCGLSGTGDLKNTDPKLGPLAANGGPTQTHELLADSPAIDKAAGGASCPATDQRGTARPQGAGCDIGAYERLFQAPQPPAPAPPPPPAVTPPPPPPATVRPPTARPRTPRVIRRCRVPNVRGKTVRQARRAITRAGCRAAVMGRRYSVSYRPGRVIGQSVRPGARVRRGTLVRLVLSRGAQPVRPPFTG